MEERVFMTRLAFWWLKYFDEIATFWRGFSWSTVIMLFVIAVLKHWDLVPIVFAVFFGGMAINVGLYLLIRTLQSHLLTLEGEDKEKAHNLMVKIILKKIGA